LQLQLEHLQKKYHANELEASKIANGTISNDILEMKWPLGVPESSAGETRHDIIPWTLLNMTHSFLWDTESNVKKLSDIDTEDIKVSKRGW
jgi:chondroitin polymerizing factor